MHFLSERNFLIERSQTPSEPCRDYFGWYWHIIFLHFPVSQHLIDWGFSLMQLFHWDPGRRVIVRAAPGVALSDCNSIISGLAMTIIPGAHRASPKLFHKLKMHVWESEIGAGKALWLWSSCQENLLKRKRWRCEFENVLFEWNNPKISSSCFLPLSLADMLFSTTFIHSYVCACVTWHCTKRKS